MIIDLKSISQEPKEFEFCLEKEWRTAENDDQILGLNEPLKVKVGIYPLEDKYLLKGELSGELKVACDRCLESFDHPIRSEFQLFFVLTEPQTNQEEMEVNEEDVETTFLSSPELELDNVIREQLYLSLPMKFICRDDCLGLCQQCGMNLNQKKCLCGKPQGHPGFSKLIFFKTGGEQE